MDEKTTEELIVEKGKTAPRVTPAAVEDAIVSEHYFTAENGAFGAALDAGFDAFECPAELALLTFCVLVLDNGFTVHGVSACASPENFDEEIVQKVARQNAVNQIWPLLGFRLRDQLDQR